MTLRPLGAAQWLQGWPELRSKILSSKNKQKVIFFLQKNFNTFKSVLKAPLGKIKLCHFYSELPMES